MKLYNLQYKLNCCIEPIYDKLGRVTQIKYNGVTKYLWDYNNDGLINRKAY